MAARPPFVAIPTAGAGAAAAHARMPDGVVHISAPSPLPPDAAMPTPISPPVRGGHSALSNIRSSKQHESAWDVAGAHRTSAVAPTGKAEEVETQSLLSTSPSVAAPMASATVGARAGEPKPNSGLSDEAFRWITIGLLALFVLLLLATAQSRHTIVLQRSVSSDPGRCLSTPFAGTMESVFEIEKHWLTPGSLERLQGSLAGKWIHLAGDSTLRLIYYDLINLLTASKQFGVAPTDQAVLTQRQATRHANQETTLPSGLRISYHWAPYLANITTDLQSVLAPDAVGVVDPTGVPLQRTIDNAPLARPDVIFASAGLWSLLYQEETSEERAQHLQRASRTLAESLWRRNWPLKAEVRARRMRASGTTDADTRQVEWADSDARHGYSDWEQRSPTMVFLSSPSLIESQLTAHRLANPRFRNANLQELNADVAQNFVANLPMLHADTHTLTSHRLVSTDDGVHSTWASSRVVLAMASFIECLYP